MKKSTINLRFLKNRIIEIDNIIQTKSIDNCIRTFGYFYINGNKLKPICIYKEGGEGNYTSYTRIQVIRDNLYLFIKNGFKQLDLLCALKQKTLLYGNEKIFEKLYEYHKETSNYLLQYIDISKYDEIIGFTTIDDIAKWDVDNEGFCIFDIDAHTHPQQHVPKEIKCRLSRIKSWF
jgi:hypothetical protein